MVDTLIAYGADPSVQDETGLTPWDHYCETLDKLENNNEITEWEKQNTLNEVSKKLNPSLDE